MIKMREFNIYEILFENSLRNFYNLYFIPPRTKSVQLKVIYFVRNVTSFLRQSFMQWCWQCWCWRVFVVSELGRNYNILTLYLVLLVTARLISANNFPGSPLQFIRQEQLAHSQSIWLPEREKTEENINQAVSWELRVVTWCLGSRLFHFLPESRPAVGGKNIFLKLPHINIRSTAANMGTEWNLFIHVKHRIST